MWIDLRDEPVIIVLDLPALRLQELLHLRDPVLKVQNRPFKLGCLLQGQEFLSQRVNDFVVLSSLEIKLDFRGPGGFLPFHLNSTPILELLLQRRNVGLAVEDAISRQSHSKINLPYIPALDSVLQESPF